MSKALMSLSQTIRMPLLFTTSLFMKKSTVPSLVYEEVFVVPPPMKNSPLSLSFYEEVTVVPSPVYEEVPAVHLTLSMRK